MRVTAWNEAGCGPPSLSLQFQAAPGVPHKPSVPHAVQRDDRTLRIYWIPPEHDGGKEIEAYRMQICPANQLTSLEDAEPFEEVYEGPRNLRDLTDLIPGTVYAIRICAVNQIGNSEWSDIGYETTPAGPPLPPQNLQIDNLDTTSLHLTWDAPEANGGAAITGYVVAFAKQGVSQCGQDNFQEAASTSCRIGDLDPSTSYLVKTKAVNENGDSEWSPALLVETHANVPPAPTGLEVVETTCTTAKLVWDPIDDDVTIRVEMETVDGNWIEQFKGKGQSCRVCGLQAGEKVTFRSRACNQYGNGPVSNSISIVLDSKPPSTPSAAIVTQITSSTLRIKWTPPSNNGKVILGYKVEIEGDDGALFEVEAPTCNARIGDLSAQTLYKLRLAAVNAVGVSAWSKAIEATTKAAPPPSPQDLKASVISAPIVKVDVSWSMGALDDACAFDVEAYVSASKKVKSLQSYKATVLHHSCTLSALERGQKYDIRVRATAAGVSGKWCSPVTIRIPEEPIAPVPPKAEIVAPLEETETTTRSRVKKGQVYVPTRSKNPLRRRKSVWKSRKFQIFVFLLVVALIVFLVLFFRQ